MKLPKFTIRDLLLAMTLIGAGLGCFLVARQLPFALCVVANACGVAAIVAGACAPFHRKALGAMFALEAVLLLIGLGILLELGSGVQ